MLIFRNNAGCSLLAYVTEIKVVVVLMSMNFTEHGKQCRKTLLMKKQQDCQKSVS